jgi:hypothetical protein
VGGGFKYMLESYEDALNNLTLQQTKNQQRQHKRQVKNYLLRVHAGYRKPDNLDAFKIHLPLTQCYRE